MDITGTTPALQELLGDNSRIEVTVQIKSFVTIVLIPTDRHLTCEYCRYGYTFPRK